MLGGLKFGLLAAALAVLISGPVAAGDIDQASLYRAQSVTSGTGEENRARGLAPCLEEVLVKVSGDPRLIGDPRVVELSGHAADYVTGFTYRDLLADRPVHDEQGTHDRPHYLTADFDPDKIDALLATLGHTPWPLPRPAIVALLDIRPMKGDGFTLVRDGGGELATNMRVALAAAALRAGLSLELPKPQDVVLADVTQTMGGDVLLAGTLAWRQEALGWVGEWQLSFKGKAYRWQVRGVSFDDAFRNAVRGTLQILSANGQPEAVTPH
jgi:hypothetical protein